jgi:bacteriocin-like protein
MNETILKPEDHVTEGAPETEKELSNEELSKVSGGRVNDPCEGGKFHSK